MPKPGRPITLRGPASRVREIRPSDIRQIRPGSLPATMDTAPNTRDVYLAPVSDMAMTLANMSPKYQALVAFSYATHTYWAGVAQELTSGQLNSRGGPGGSTVRELPTTIITDMQGDRIRTDVIEKRRFNTPIIRLYSVITYMKDGKIHTKVSYLPSGKPTTHLSRVAHKPKSR